VREDNTLQFDNRVIEITSERVVQFRKAADAEAAAAARYRSEFAAAQARYDAERTRDEARHRAFEQQQAEYDRRYEEYQGCQTAAMEQLARVGMAMLSDETMLLNQRMAALSDAQRSTLDARLEQYRQRAEAAERRNDAAAARAVRGELVADLARTLDMSESDVDKAMRVSGAGAETTRAAARGPEACGPAPTRPTPPEGLATDPQTTMGTLEAYTARAAALASGLTEQQYAVMRERIVSFLKNQDGVPFTGNELNALRSNEAALRQYESQLTG
jgi:hypothetical protein